MKAPHINPSLVATFQRDPSSKAADAIFEAVEALACHLPGGGTLFDEISGLIIRSRDSRIALEIGTDGSLNATLVDEPMSAWEVDE
ncbi:hypothetical protein [Thiorhodovibrio frisius]|uniref:Uncharacterized protein n=1 Tax=Thiorhodovibrio frisius TaxID=631362 RepID=H8Z5F6_9GAMM|nr:hypothetical protein [Thiorhodovibrio frisius]EIC19502.1 hypothetical protein Thi970DRAFT_03080 [Thiorhodovibrio frisius]WPL20535.1 hypothetical protein Thiofri_00634 [Thiorhodovibrio frisius]